MGETDKIQMFERACAWENAQLWCVNNNWNEGIVVVFKRTPPPSDTQGFLGPPICIPEIILGAILVDSSYTQACFGICQMACAMHMLRILPSQPAPPLAGNEHRSDIVMKISEHTPSLPHPNHPIQLHLVLCLLVTMKCIEPSPCLFHKRSTLFWNINNNNHY